MSWARVHGHDPLRHAFARIWAKGRLAHAYLFVGPDGVGKRLFAVELSKAILCETAGDSFDACDRCPACLQIEAGTHPDFQLVGLTEEQHEFPVDLMHETIRHLGLKPARGKHRVTIIDDADRINEESANCFLKTLEEPPPASLLILVGTTAERQLPTIISRCQVVRFHPLPETEVRAFLGRQEEPPVPEEIDRIARASGGSLAQALLLSDPELWKFRAELLDALAGPRFDSVAWSGKLWGFIDAAAKESGPKRVRARQMIRFVVDFLRAALILRQGRAATGFDGTERKGVETLATRLSDEQLMTAIDRSLEADWQVVRRLQLVLVVEGWLDALGTKIQAARAGGR